MNLVEGLQAACEEQREFIKEIQEAVELMGPRARHGGTALSIEFAKAQIKMAERAIASGDVVEMVRAYAIMKPEEAEAAP